MTRPSQSGLVRCLSAGFATKSSRFPGRSTNKGAVLQQTDAGTDATLRHTEKVVDVVLDWRTAGKLIEVLRDDGAP